MKLLSSFTQLKVSWLESIMLFKPVSLKLFLLVTLKSLGSLYTSLPSQGLLFFLYIPLLFAYKVYIAGGKWAIEDLLLVGAGSYVVALLVQAVRSSIDYKDAQYWRIHEVVFLKLYAGVFFLCYLPYAYFYHRPIHYSGLIFAFVCLIAPLKIKISPAFSGLLFYIVLIAALSSTALPRPFDIPPHGLVTFFTWLQAFLLIKLPALESILGVFAYFFSPVVIVWTLFMYDAQKTIREYMHALVKTLSMVIYNYPFFLITYTIFYFSVILIHAISSWILPPWHGWHFIGWIGFIFLLLPFYICFITNFYIKRIHEQFSLYYR